MTDTEVKTGVVRNLVVGLPKACGVPDGLAEIFAEHNGKLFDWEKDNPAGSLNRKNYKTDEDRLIHGFAWLPLADSGHGQYGLDLLVFASRSIDVNSKGFVYHGLDDDRSALEAEEADHPEVAALMTVVMAGTLTSWN